MSKKLVPLVAIAFVIAAIFTAVFYTLFSVRLSGAPAALRNSPSKVLVAARDLAPGTVLAEADVRAIQCAGDHLLKGVFPSFEKLTGKTVLQATASGEPILESHLAAKDGAGIGVPAGMRAVSIHVSDSAGVVGLLKPGFKVDIQVYAWQSRKAARLDEMRTLLRGVSVLAVCTQPEQSSQGYFTAPVVTLLVSAADAEQLALADSYARLRLTLRNPLEPNKPVPSEPTPSKPYARLRVRALSLSDEDLSMLTRLISGLDGTDGTSPYAKSRHPVLLVVPEPLAAAKAAR